LEKFEFKQSTSKLKSGQSALHRDVAPAARRASALAALGVRVPARFPMPPPPEARAS
jgi:hypothetical protein